MDTHLDSWDVAVAVFATAIALFIIWLCLAIARLLAFFSDKIRQGKKSLSSDPKQSDAEES